MAQLKANFNADKQGGCSPLTVAFSNTSSASSAAVYEWDFGNGNTSSLKNPGAVFLDQKEYFVTLRVKDGNETSSSTQTITVYKKPVIDFSSSVKKLCTPEPVSFTANATADKGNIVEYVWDFGDGFTGNGYNPEISHTYLSGQKPSVTLSVTDNHGCSNNKTINNIITVLPGVTAAFNADKTFVCFETDPVKMINNSIGEGALSYTWNFGDGITSTEKNPVHVFNKKGTYTVGLSVESALGCKNTLTKTAFLNVGEFKSDFSVPDIICKNSLLELKNTSAPASTSFSWLVDGVQTVYSDYYGDYNYTFGTAGTHTIKLTNKFGGCEQIVTKKVDIKELLQPKGFITEFPEHCSPPVTVNFKDTSKGAVKSEWNFERTYYPLPVQATGKTASYTFTQSNNWYVTLFVTDVNGCKNSIEQPVIITQPYIYITTIDNNGLNGCGTLTKKFKFITDETLASFQWDFGDGTTSKEAEPEHTFTSLGQKLVKLKYTTVKGCTAEVYFYDIVISSKPNADFISTSGTTICGNSIIQLKSERYYVNDYWFFDGEYSSGSYYGIQQWQFKDTGKHIITHIIYTPGCSDTVTKKDYITVLPSFPKITEANNTCDGDRGTVLFKHDSKYAVSGTWDFGDGTTAAFKKDATEMSHHYTKSGNYKVVLTTSNGQCTNQDSLLNVIVILKSNMVLSSIKPDFCQEDGLTYSITNLAPETYILQARYYIHSYLYSDGSSFPLGNSSYEYENRVNEPTYNNVLKNIPKGINAIRIVTTVEMFEPTPPFYIICFDTTNFIPIKIKGAVAGFEITSNNVCFREPVTFRDTSKAENTTIVSRQWDFGDGQYQTVTTGGTVPHVYSNPGNYYVTLKVTDAGGCTSTTSSYSQTVSVNGPKADFSVSEVNAHLNATIYFYNNTNNYNSYNTRYEWQFGDGHSSQEFSPSYTYTKPGNYKIRLIAKNLDTGCTDTAYQEITVKNFNANFSFTSSFINNVDCSPTLVQFNNTSFDYTHIKWDFGDGFTSDNINYPSHLYTLPGKYIIRLLVTGNNGLSKTYTDSVIIKNNKINLKADILHSCTSQSVTLSALAENASSYLWDFGDGTIVEATDTFSVHNYIRAGVYNPKLIIKDGNGCAASINLSDKIVIDSLFVSLSNLPEKICTPKNILFNPVVENIAADQAQQPLVYHWDFGTGNKSDTSNLKTPSFTYQQPGKYPVSLKVQSPYGCAKEVKAEIIALQGLGGQINGPLDICQGSAAQFTGTTQLPGQPLWRWIFDDGTIVQQQNPPAKKYDDAGNFLIKLIVDNNGCIDTVTRTLEVHAKPTINLSIMQAVICEGSGIPITAGGSSSYSWLPSAGLNNATAASVIAAPLNNTDYLVTATNTFGCSNTETVKITVVHPFELQLAKEAVVCSGKSIELKASGGVSYQWIDNTTGLSNTTIANPMAIPEITTTYTLVATDEKQCFTDTASIKVLVRQSPLVDAGPGGEILAGTTYQFQATASNDVVNWNWSPDKYLNCINCAAPKAAPLEPMSYTVTVTNAQGCAASNTVSIKLFCSESSIYIPNAFTPNNDGVNDQFTIKGQGITTLNHLRIFNSWGTLIFERSNLKMDDKRAAWDGKYKGEPVPTGVYVYIVEMSCNEKTFSQKGAVTVLY